MEMFVCKLKYSKELENGKIKKTTDSYLVDAMSFTEAEAIANEKGSDFIFTTFVVDAVKKEKVSEIFKSENDEGIWVKAKIQYITIDEVSSKEKRTCVTIYQQTKDMLSVTRDIKESLKDSVVDWEIKSVTETKILGIF